MIANMILALFLLALSGFVLRTAYSWPDFSRLSVVGPDLVPKLLGYFFLFVALVLLAQAAYKIWIKKTDENGNSYWKLELEGAARLRGRLSENAGGILSAVCIPLLILFYGLAVKPVGFEICTVVFLFLCLLLCRERRWYILVFTPLLSTAAIYIVFKVLLRVSLPLRFLG